MPRCKKEIGGIGDIINTIASNINRARENDPTRHAQARYQRRIMTPRGEYSGGDFGGAGSGTIITDTPEYNYTQRNDTIYVPITRTFNDAFNDARRAGLSEFEFNGNRYTTEMGDNPNSTAAGNARTETDLLRFIRYNTDKNKVNKDGSTRRVGTKTTYGFRNGGVISINGNVKNGLIYYSTSPFTGELHDKSVMRCGGKKRCGGRNKAELGDWIRNAYNRGRNAFMDLSEYLFNDKLTDASPEVVNTERRLRTVGRGIKNTAKRSIPAAAATYVIDKAMDEAKQMQTEGRGVYDNSADNTDDKGNRPGLGIYNLNLPGVDTSNAGYSMPNISISGNLDYTNYYPNTTGTGMLTLPKRNSNVQQRAIEQGQAALRGNALERNRPQYYAQRDLPLFEDGAAIQSGLVRAGWSHGRGVGNLIDIPTMNVDLNNYSFGSAPRRGSSQAASPVPDNRPAPEAPTRTTPSFAVDANLDPGTIPTSVVQAAHQQAADANARQYGVYDGVTPRDWMSLAGNVAGSIGSWLASRNAPKVNIAEPLRPFIETPVRLRTRYNNRPQIAAVRENTRRAYNDIRQNTASSSAALSRMQRARNAAVQNINELEANRQNIETQLTNADRMNRQQVRSRNARVMNQYYQDVASARTRQSIADAQRKSANQAALSNLFNNVNLSFQDFLGRMDRREAFNNTLAYLRAANPDYDDRMFKDNGARFADMYLQGLNRKV